LANEDNNTVWSKTKKTLTNGADVVQDTFDVIGDATSNVAKKMAGKPNTSMETAVEKGD
jgi:uncharacterized phosphosugar-binding protein